MSTLIIEHLAASELPPQWAQRMKIRKGQKVTVRIETEPETTGVEISEPFVTDDPAFGIWRDRDDGADVDTFLHRLRSSRYGRDGSRGPG